MSEWRVLARMPDRSIGGVLVGAEFKLNLRHNEVGSFELTVPQESTPAGWPAPESGVIFIRGIEVIASGAWDVNEFEQSARDEPAGMIKLQGDTDLGRAQYRIVYPAPDNHWQNQPDQQTHYRHLARPEAALRTIISRQAGPAARAERRTPGLTIAADTNIPGANYQVEERFTPLLDAARRIAHAGNLGFDIVDTLQGTTQLRVWPTRDLSNTIRFGWDLNNVTELYVAEESPKANVALVAGQEIDEELVERRQAVQVVDSTSQWGRREMFVDQRQTDEEGKHVEAGEEAIESNREQTAVSATIVDTETVRWKRDYDRGDRVSVLTRFGPVTDIVREVEVSVSASGVEDVKSTIGSRQTAIEDPLVETVRRLSERISQLEMGF